MVDRVQFEAQESGATPPPQQEAPKAPAQAPGERPSWLPEQFATPEDMAKNWTEQRAEVTRLQQNAKKPEAPETPPKDPALQQPPKEGEQTPPEKGKEQEQNAAAQDAANAAGVDLNPYQTEYASTGDVSEKSREELAKGLEKVLGPNARSIVDDFVEARKVVHQNDQKLFMDSAGGAENYAQITQWASKSLPKEQVEAYNRTVNSGDRHATLLAIEGLRAKFEAANGRAPNLISGGGMPGTTAFRSTSEMVTAMNDPRYKTDEAYREDVRRRLSASQF